VRAGKLINYVGFVPTDEEMKESWSAPGDPDVLRREFAGWDPRIGIAERGRAHVPLGAV
jgi:salicylate hydroxylase